ncbi:M48 family metallopeptidase [Massilia sp. R2A-15]|uniref:M48 family metallopeptidase n=1 Tax=Massilia sp. R2A-15 TaxID=3064278 RepID=UPI002733F8AD|nr:M48 family metallopeptidase [Massilia sp. R2A-15]WLI89681.1 M48 family metallopeptidase [Massilia sp. R2A-15]
MKTFKQIVLAAALCVGFGAGAAQAPVVQDGIQVKPLPSYRVLASEEKLERESQLQYAQLMSKAQEKHALAPDNNPQLIRLRAIAKRIIPYTARWNPDAVKWQWQVNLLGSKQVNAFCMPGGRIAFFSGIIDTLNLTDDEIAAIMGHEISHALREHGRAREVKNTGTQILARLGGAAAAAYFGFDPRLTDSLAQKAGQVVALKFSRDDEREADLIGLDLASRAGFDPRAGVALWQKMAALNKRQPLTFLSTHPSGANRIELINEHMNALLPVYARARSTNVAQLPPYRTTALPN